MKDVGPFAGWLSLVIILIRLVLDRPNLKFHEGNCYHLFGETGDSTIHINLAVDNVGKRGTTIRDITLIKTMPEDYSPRITKELYGFETQHVPPHSSIKIHHKIFLKDFLLRDEKIKVDLEIAHTNSKVRMIVTSLFLQRGKPLSSV